MKNTREERQEKNKKGKDKDRWIKQIKKTTRKEQKRIIKKN